MVPVWRPIGAPAVSSGQVAQSAPWPATIASQYAWVASRLSTRPPRSSWTSARAFGSVTQAPAGVAATQAAAGSAVDPSRRPVRASTRTSRDRSAFTSPIVQTSRPATARSHVRSLPTRTPRSIRAMTRFVCALIWTRRFPASTQTEPSPIAMALGDAPTGAGVCELMTATSAATTERTRIQPLRRRCLERSGNQRTRDPPATAAPVTAERTVR